MKAVEGDSSYTGKTFTSKTLEQLIFESDDFGEVSRFKIFNENREDTFRTIVKNIKITPKDETQQKILSNYSVISDYYDNYLKDKSNHVLLETLFD